MMDLNILYNIKFRKELPASILGAFKDCGFVTGSSLIETDNKDVDIVVLCSKSLVSSIVQKSVTDDLAQVMFDYLLDNSYSLYIKGNYRDSTFLSCYIHHNSVLYNLLLMDELNVFDEWQYATAALIRHASNDELKIKYRRIKFFETKRKEFRRTLRKSVITTEES